MKKRLLIISLVALLLSGCLGNSISQKTYNISGWINKSEDNQPLNGVKLLVNSTTVETNAEGRFKVLGLSGTTVVTPVLNGWRFEPESIEVGGKRDDLVFMAYNPEKETLGNVKVSLIGSYGSTQTASIRPLMHDREHFPFTPEIYSKDFQNPGELVERFTPHKFIAALNGIAAHSPNRSPVRFFRTPSVNSGGGGFGLPVNFDFAMSPDVIDASYILERGRFDAEALMIQIGIRNARRSDGLTALSEIHVDLGEKYKDVTFANELPHLKYNTTHVFELVDLIPLEGQRRPLNLELVFGSYITEPYILNPDGSNIQGYARFPWEEGSKSATLLAYAIHLPGFQLEFEEGIENHLVFSWNLEDLIEIYDNNSDDPSDHLVTLRLDDPFPVELFVEQNVSYVPSEIEQRPTEEVNNLEGMYYDLLEKEIFLGWLNPSDHQYDKTHIVRKVGSAPRNFDDGKLVYSGNDTIFRDSDIEPGNHYFYKVFTQSRAGVLSEGSVINIISQGASLERVNIEMWTPEGNISPRILSLKVGEQSDDLRIMGYDKNDRYSPRLIADWILDENIGVLNRKKGEIVNIKAETPGEAYLIATHSSGLQSRILVKVTE